MICSRVISLAVLAWSQSVLAEVRFTMDMSNLNPIVNKEIPFRLRWTGARGQTVDVAFVDAATGANVDLVTQGPGFAYNWVPPPELTGHKGSFVISDGYSTDSTSVFTIMDGSEPSFQPPTATPSSKPPDSATTSRIGPDVMAGIIVGVLLFVALCAGIVFYCFWFRKRRPAEKRNTDHVSKDGNDGKALLSPSTLSVQELGAVPSYGAKPIVSELGTTETQQTMSELATDRRNTIMAELEAPIFEKQSAQAPPYEQSLQAAPYESGQTVSDMGSTVYSSTTVSDMGSTFIASNTIASHMDHSPTMPITSIVQLPPLLGESRESWYIDEKCLESDMSREFH